MLLCPTNMDLNIDLLLGNIRKIGVYIIFLGKDLFKMNFIITLS